MVDAFIKGLALSLLLVVSVGPIVFTVIKQSIINGRYGGLSFVAGIWLSDVLMVILSNVFSEVVRNLLDFKKPIGISGGLLLICMGVYYLFFKKLKERSAEDDSIKVSAGTHAKLVASGFLINLLNPGIIAFWLTTTTTIAITHTIKERILIFSTCIIFNLAADVAKVILADKLSAKLNHKNLTVITKISGALLIAFGVVLLVGVIYTTAPQ
jgi:threonine/homoserine/homoserine lactone efflux protein